MFGKLLAIAIIGATVLQPGAVLARAQPDCGALFADLKNALGDTIGEPRACEHLDSGGTNAVRQVTTLGVGMYQPSSGILSFTNGTESWAVTPTGVLYWTGGGTEPTSDAIPWYRVSFPDYADSARSEPDKEILLTTAAAITAQLRHAGVPDLDDYFHGRARWTRELDDVGLPVGESATIVLPDGTLRSFLHASTQSTHGVLRDKDGGLVRFPGCVTAWDSTDGGRTFHLTTPTCVFPCAFAACQGDHTYQQQYPKVAVAPDGVLYVAYEFSVDGMISGTALRQSFDWGQTWSPEEWVPGTGECPPGDPERCTAFWGDTYVSNGRPLTQVGHCINTHGFGQEEGSFLAGGPPGVFVDGDELYVFVDLGSCPSSIGCIRGSRFEPAERMRPCDTAPLVAGSAEYGLGKTGRDANAYMDFRYATSAEVVSAKRSFYMFWEGERGGGEWGLNLAASDAIDTPWVRSRLNPALMDAPILNGMGHTDLLEFGGRWHLYTSTSNTTRGRYSLEWTL